MGLCQENLSSVIKDSKKDVSYVANYRPLNIISEISKLFEICIYKRINSHLKVKVMQFGFVIWMAVVIRVYLLCKIL